MRTIPNYSNVVMKYENYINYSTHEAVLYRLYSNSKSTLSLNTGYADSLHPTDIGAVLTELENLGWINFFPIGIPAHTGIWIITGAGRIAADELVLARNS